MSQQPERTLADIIRAARMAANLSQQDLADRVGLGMTQRDVSFIESGRNKRPNPARLDKLAAVLDIPRDDIYQSSGYAAYWLRGAAPDPSVVRYFASISGDRGALIDVAADLSNAAVAQLLSYARWLAADEAEKGITDGTDEDDEHIPSGATRLG